LSESKADLDRVMVITVLVEADGSSRLIAVRSQQGETISSNHPYHRIARSLVEEWRFQPAHTVGQAVASLLDVEVKLVSR
jgi:ribosomal protein L5